MDIENGEDCHRLDEEVVLNNMKLNYSRIVEEMKRYEQEITLINLKNDTEVSKISHKLAQQTAYYDKLVNDQVGRINELEETIKRQEIEENDRTRKEIRKYIENINETEEQNGNLRRQISTLKNKITSLQNQIASVSNVNDNLEVFIIKGLQQLKVSGKDTNNSVDEIDTEKMVMESKFKQTNQKINLLNDRINQLEIKSKNTEQNYQKLKVLFRISKDQCLNQKFKIQSLKLQIRSTKLNHVSPQQSNSQQMLIQQVEKIYRLSDSLQEKEEFLKQVADYQSMNIELIEQNTNLKNTISVLEQDLENLKGKYINQYEDQTLLKRQPSLYEFLKEKKKQLISFEQTIQKIQSFIEGKDELINKIISNISEKHLGCSCGKQAELENMRHQFENITKKNEMLQQTNVKIRKQNARQEKTISSYKSEMNDFLRGKINKKKKRCIWCVLPIQKGDSTQTCNECKKPFHQACINDHHCDSYKLDGSQSCVSMGE